MEIISDENHFQKAVLASKLPILVDFWAKWCGPCLAAAPILDDLAKEYIDKLGFAKVNVDDHNALASKYGIAAIPTMLIFKEGQPIQQIVGFKQKKELKKILDNLLGG